MFHRNLSAQLWTTLALITLMALPPNYSWSQANQAELSTSEVNSDSPVAQRDDAKDMAMFNHASGSIEQGRTEIGMALLKQLIQLRDDFENMSPLTLQIAEKLALSYLREGDYSAAVYLANAMTRSKSSDIDCRIRAAAYKKLALPSVEFEELRNALFMNPTEISAQMELAIGLALPTMIHCRTVLALPNSPACPIVWLRSDHPIST